MRLCIPTLDDRGLDARPSEHFGSAPFFTLVNIETEEVVVISNGDRHHAHGQCDPLEHLTEQSVDLLVCQGLGRRALTRLSERGIPVFITRKPTVSAILAAHREGHLTRMTTEEACHGGGHGSGHGGGHGGGHGCD